MSKAPHVLVIVILSSFLISPVLARPVTSADLYNKKICWNNGFISTYNKDGSFDGNRSGHGTWNLNGDLLTVNADHGSKQYQQRRGHFSQHSEGLEERPEYRILGQLLQLSV